MHQGHVSQNLYRQPQITLLVVTEFNLSETQRQQPSQTVEQWR